MASLWHDEYLWCARLCLWVCPLVAVELMQWTTAAAWCLKKRSCVGFRFVTLQCDRPAHLIYL